MPQTIARWLLATLIVAVPVSYLFWQWANDDPKVLEGFSYAAFHDRLAASPPAFWSYALYMMVATAVVVLLHTLVFRGLGKVFPAPVEGRGKR